MRKVLWTEDGEQLDKTHPGCISSIFHVLDYEYWHSNVKKMLPHRKHDVLHSRAKRNRRHKRISQDQDPFEVLKLLEAETSPILVDESSRKTSSTQKKSLKVRMKALVDVFKEENDKERGQESVSSPRLQRTYAVHHLENNEWVHPIVFFPENVNNEESSENITQKPVSFKDSGKDVFEIFKVNKELFANILQDGPRNPNTKAKLTKSGSFPVAYKSGGRSLRPTKLEHKLNEFYSISKNEKRLDTPAPKLDSSNKEGVKNSDDDLKDNDFMRIRRISSLNESAERYAQLFNFSVGKEAVLQPSRSLRLTNESENSSSFFRRIRSFPHRDNREFRYIHFVRSASQNERNRVSLPSSTDKTDTFSENEHSMCEPVHPIDVGKPESVGLGDDASMFTIEENDHRKAPEFQMLEDLESLINSEENLEKEIKNVNPEADDFTYVKQILERSGFIKTGFEQKWYSSNQPLDPFIFQEIESQYFHDPDCFAEEFNELSHRLLIFDLLDDVLFTTYERSITYYPKALSSSCHIRSSPTGPHFLDEIWKNVSRLLESKPDMNQSLDSIVSKDLRTDDSWMNLQMDSEFVGLDLEDLILDEVLKEVLFECSLIEGVVW